MGSYITAAEIVTYTGTILSTAELNAMIDDAEAEVGERVTSQGVTPVATSRLLKLAVRCFTLIAILQRYRMDGTKPKTLTMGSTTLSDDVDANIDYLDKTAQSKIDLFVSLNGGGEALSDVSLEEVWVRHDHEMPTYNLDQSKIKEYHEEADDTSNQDTDFGSIPGGGSYSSIPGPVVPTPYQTYYGESPSTSLTEAMIIALRMGVNQARDGTYVFLGGGYKYMAFPVSAGAPTSFIDASNGFPVAMDLTVVVTSIGGVNYNVYRTLNTLAGAIGIVVS